MEMTNLFLGSSVPGNIHGTHWVRPTTSLDIIAEINLKQRTLQTTPQGTILSENKIFNRQNKQSRIDGIQDLLPRSQEPDTAPYGKAVCP